MNDPAKTALVFIPVDAGDAVMGVFDGEPKTRDEPGLGVYLEEGAEPCVADIK